MEEMNIKSRLWIEKDNKPVFGNGKYKLLKLIDEKGSINKAAKEMKMSYRKAWGDVKSMEERLGIKLVETKTGGKSGGGAKLTSDAYELIEKYNRFRKDVDEIINEKFSGVFI